MIYIDGDLSDVSIENTLAWFREKRNNEAARLHDKIIEESCDTMTLEEILRSIIRINDQIKLMKEIGLAYKYGQQPESLRITEPK